MEGTKPDVLQDGPRDEQCNRNDNQEGINRPLSSAPEASTAEYSRNEGGDGTADPPLYSPFKNFSSRPPLDAVSRPTFAKPPLLRPSVFSGSLADVGGVASKPDSGSLTSIFGARPNPFALSSRDQISTAGSSKPFLLRPSKLGTGSSEVDKETTYSPFASSMYGSKSVTSSDTSTGPPTGTTASRPIFLRPSKLDTGSEQDQTSSDQTDQTSSNVEKQLAATSETRSYAAEGDNSSKPGLLRPSQLAATTADLQISEKAKLPNNPFARVHISGEEKEEKGNEVSTKPDEDGEVEEAQDSKTPSPPKFVRLNPGSSVVNPVMSVASAPPTFVFGQNLLDRVETKEKNGTNQQNAETNGASSSEMLFTSVVRKEDSNDGSSIEATERPSKSLSDAAREYEESRAAKRKYEEVAVVTGEEDEANVMQMNCKLYAFDKAKGSWVERGRGTLRLNDRESPRGVTSRVVVRTAGSLRVVINTKVWAGMVAERASPKSLRLTAMDSAGEVKVFLLAGSQKDTEQLLRALHARVLRMRAAGAGDSDAACANPEAKRVAQDASGDEDDDDDDEDVDVGEENDGGAGADNDNGDADTGEAGPGH